jgi:hypothetical protein
MLKKIQRRASRINLRTKKVTVTLELDCLQWVNYEEVFVSTASTPPSSLNVLPNSTTAPVPSQKVQSMPLPIGSFLSMSLEKGLNRVFTSNEQELTYNEMIALHEMSNPLHHNGSEKESKIACVRWNEKVEFSSTLYLDTKTQLFQEKAIPLKLRVRKGVGTNGGAEDNLSPTAAAMSALFKKDLFNVDPKTLLSASHHLMLGKFLVNLHDIIHNELLAPPSSKQHALHILTKENEGLSPPPPTVSGNGTILDHLRDFSKEVMFRLVENPDIILKGKIIIEFMPDTPPSVPSVSHPVENYLSKFMTGMVHSSDFKQTEGEGGGNQQHDENDHDHDHDEDDEDIGGSDDEVFDDNLSSISSLTSINSPNTKKRSRKSLFSDHLSFVDNILPHLKPTNPFHSYANGFLSKKKKGSNSNNDMRKGPPAVLTRQSSEESNDNSFDGDYSPLEGTVPPSGPSEVAVRKPLDISSYEANLDKRSVNENRNPFTLVSLSIFFCFSCFVAYLFSSVPLL